MPLTILIHQERKVFLMVVGVVSQNIEYGTTEQFFYLRLGDPKFACRTKQIFITMSIRIYGRKGLDKHFLAIFTIKAPRQEMTHALNFYKPAWHHAYSCSYCHFVISHLYFREGMFRSVELQDAVLERRISSRLAAINRFIRGYGHYGFHLPSTSGSADCY